MQQSGLIVHIQDDKATVRFTRSKSCAHCGACIRFGDNEMQVEVENTLHAQAGDRVCVELHAKSFVQASFLAYIVPLALLLLGVGLGSSLGGDLLGVVCGLGGALIAFFILKGLEPRIARNKKFHPHMVSIEINNKGDHEHV